MIDKLALIHIRDGKLLVARSKERELFYVPGGKRDPGESDIQALTREIREELAVELDRDSIQYADTFTALADNKPHGSVVKVTAYCADYTGVAQANAEIEELRWVSVNEKSQCSLVTQDIIDWLVQKNYLQEASHQQKLKRTNGALQNSYDWVFFDADNTLFHFHDFKGLELMFSRLGVEFTWDDFHDYHEINVKLWKQYEQHLIKIEELVSTRFNKWSTQLDIPSKTLNSYFMQAMAEVCTPLDGAVSLIHCLHEQGMKLGIVSNGFIELQQVRLKHNKLENYFDFVVTSEEAGTAKPHAGIFELAFERAGNPDKQTVLMVGDNVGADIRGGLDFGIDTCWLNSSHSPAPSDIQSTAMVSSLFELEQLLYDEKV